MTEAASQGRVISWQRKSIGLAVLVVVGLVFYQFLSGNLMTFTILGDSMSPSLRDGDKLFVSLEMDEPLDRGNLVIFFDPRPQLNDDLLIKRLIALPGDRVTIRNRRLRVNGVAEFILGLTDPRVPDLADDEFVVPPDSLYVLGDNREVSFDSSEFDFLSQRNVIGVATYRFSPWNQRGSLD